MAKTILISISIVIAIYFGISLLLVFLPVPHQTAIENYDYSSIQALKENKPQGEERWLVLRDSSKLFYRYYPSEARCTLILIHGSGSESRYLQNFASELASTGVARVITPDLRGHGRTSRTKGDISYMGQLEDDLEDLIRDVRTQYPQEKIIVGGHSSGGGFALRCAGNPAFKDVDAYLLLAPYLGYDAPTVKPNSGDWVTVATKRWIGLSMLNNVGIQTFNSLPVLFFNRPKNLEDSLQATSYSYRLAMSFQPHQYSEDIQKIHCPTLVLVGDQDESFYSDQFSLVFGKSNWAEVKVISGAKHLDLMNHPVSKSIISNWIRSLTTAK